MRYVALCENVKIDNFVKIDELCQNEDYDQITYKWFCIHENMMKYE